MPKATAAAPLSGIAANTVVTLNDNTSNQNYTQTVSWNNSAVFKDLPAGDNVKVSVPTVTNIAGLAFTSAWSMNRDYPCGYHADGLTHDNAQTSCTGPAGYQTQAFQFSHALMGS